MAKSDLGDKAINIGIFAAVVVGLYFLYKWLKANIGGNGGTIFGGPGTSAGSGAPSQASGGDINAALNNVGNKIAAGFNVIMAPTNKITRLGLELSIANVQAKRFDRRPGSNIVINKVLKAVNKLSDVEFMAAINEWQKHDRFTNFLDTPLATGLIYTGEHSAFLIKYQRINNIYNPGLHK